MANDKRGKLQPSLEYQWRYRSAAAGTATSNNLKNYLYLIREFYCISNCKSTFRNVRPLPQWKKGMAVSAKASDICIFFIILICQYTSWRMPANQSEFAACLPFSLTISLRYGLFLHHRRHHHSIGVVWAIWFDIYTHIHILAQHSTHRERKRKRIKKHSVCKRTVKFIFSLGWID